MQNHVAMEQFHLTVTVPRGLRAAEYGAICRTLDGAAFRSGLRKAARTVVGRYPSLAKVRVTLTR
jgi:hypothetical protein